VYTKNNIGTSVLGKIHRIHMLRINNILSIGIIIDFIFKNKINDVIYYNLYGDQWTLYF